MFAAGAWAIATMPPIESMAAAVVVAARDLSVMTGSFESRSFMDCLLYGSCARGQTGVRPWSDPLEFVYGLLSLPPDLTRGAARPWDRSSSRGGPGCNRKGGPPSAALRCRRRASADRWG